MRLIGRLALWTNQRRLSFTFIVTYLSWRARIAHIVQVSKHCPPPPSDASTPQTPAWLSV